MASDPVRLYTPEEYLELERASLERHEYRNGIIVAMSGGTRNHSLIVLNFGAELHNQLRGRPCETHGSDMKVRVSTTGLFTYPDVTVVCGEPQFHDATQDMLINPTLVIDVLSPSTEHYDRTEKFAHYRRLDSLKEYLLVSQSEALVEGFRRQGDIWAYRAVSGLDAVYRIDSIDCTVSLRDVYARVRFPDSGADPTGGNGAKPDASPPQ